MTLAAIWFALVFVLLIGYTVLDGYDLGVGILHLLGRDEAERRTSLNAVAPVWDGNEVWLLTGGGALFAAFPAAYATVFSGFYTALMLLLAALIARVVALEFRSKVDSPAWKRVWDVAFALGSLLPAVLLGVAMGNILRGVPIDAEGEYTGTFWGLLNPLALLTGVLALAACTMHGAIYLAGKSQGEMRRRLGRTVGPLCVVFAVLALAAGVASAFVSPFLFEGALGSPGRWGLLVLAAGATAAAVPLARRERFGWALVASGAAIGSIMALAALGLFPRLVPSITDLSYSLTVTNCSSTPPTLTAMLIIALVGMPVVLVYTVLAHRVFRGKVVLTGDSY